MGYFCDIVEVKEFGKLVWVSGCTLDADRSLELVFLGDGAPGFGIWLPSIILMPFRLLIDVMPKNISKRLLTQLFHSERSGSIGWKGSRKPYGKVRWNRG